MCGENEQEEGTAAFDNPEQGDMAEGRVSRHPVEAATFHDD